MVLPYWSLFNPMSITQHSRPSYLTRAGRAVGNYAWENRDRIASRAGEIVRDSNFFKTGMGSNKRFRGSKRKRSGGNSGRQYSSGDGGTAGPNTRKMVHARPKKGKRESMKTILYKQIFKPFQSQYLCGTTLQGQKNQRVIYSLWQGSVSNAFAYVQGHRSTNSLTMVTEGASGVADTFKAGQFTSQNVCFDINCQYEVINLGNCEMKLKVYEMVFRNNIAVVNLAKASTGLFDFLGNSERGADNASKDMGIENLTGAKFPLPTSVTRSQYMPGWTPFCVGDITSNFKIVKTHNVYLGPKEKSHFNVSNGKKIMNYAKLSGLNVDGIEVMPHYTKLLLITWIGETVVADLQAAIGTSTGDLAVVCKGKVKGYFIPKKTPAMEYDNASPDGWSSITSLNPADGLTYNVPIHSIVQTTAGDDVANVDGP